MFTYLNHELTGPVSATSIFRSSEGEAKIMALYQSQLASLPFECETRMLDTMFGLAQVLVIGPEDAPAVVFLHDICLSAPYDLELWFPLSSRYRVYSVDVIDQPGKSAELRPPLRHHYYGKWIKDILGGLSLESPTLVGISYGAAVLLDTAAHAPDCVSKAVLVTPAGIADGSALQKFSLCSKVHVPWTFYRFFPSYDRLLRAATPLMNDGDETFLQHLDLYIRHVKWQVAFPRTFTAKELERFSAPTLLLLARGDIFFPVDRVTRRAGEIIPNLAAVEMIDEPHFPTRLALFQIGRRIQKFLEETR